MFKQGEAVIYGASGVCRIEGVEKLSMGGETKEYYALRPICSNHSSLYVPLDSPVLTGRMHQLISKDEISKLTKLFDSIEPLWIEDDNERKAKFASALAENDRELIFAYIKGAKIRRDEKNAIGKKLHVVDERFVKDAIKILCDEASFVLGSNKEEVYPFLDGFTLKY